jgi:hypothetical protein
MNMKTFKSAIMVIISIVFVVGLCSQAWAKKQAGPTPGPTSVNDLKKYKFIKVISSTRLDITPKVVDPGDTLSFRGTVSCSELNQHIEDPDDYLKPGDQFNVIVYEKNFSWGAWATVTCPVTTIYNHEWTDFDGSVEPYVVPSDAQPGQVITFDLALVWLVFPTEWSLAESSVQVRKPRPGLKERAIERKPIIEQKPATKEQKPMIKQQRIQEQQTN